MRYLVSGIFVALAGLAIVGCSERPQSKTIPVAETKDAKEQEEIEIQEALAKLSPEDRKLAEAQRFCVIQTDSRLGEMGPPIKLEVKGHPVFLCCKGCRREALADPDKTLATLDKLTAKK